MGEIAELKAKLVAHEHRIEILEDTIAALLSSFKVGFLETLAALRSTSRLHLQSVPGLPCIVFSSCVLI